MLSPENEDLSRKFILEGILFARLDSTISSDCNDPSVGPCHLSAVRLKKVTTTRSAAVEMDGGRLLSCLAGGGAAAAVLINHADGVDKRHRQ